MVDEASRRAREEVFDEVFEELSGTLLLTTSTVEDVAGVASTIDDGVAEEGIRVLTDESTAKQVRERFLLASRLVDMADGETLSLRVLEPPSPGSTLLIGTDDIRGIASISKTPVAAMRAEEDQVDVETAREQFNDQWERADSFSARTPAYSEMMRTLGQQLGEGIRADVETVFEAVMNDRVDYTEVQPVRSCLLFGARNEVQFYRLGLWGESEGVASRAKFSREKQTLEEHGLIDTEKVPTDVGRPRQRLVLGEDLRGMDALELVSAARSVLPD